MPPKERDIQRNLKILKLVEETGLVGRTCRYFDIGRASFYRWKAALEKHGEDALVRKKPIPKNPRNRTAPAIVEIGDQPDVGLVLDRRLAIVGPHVALVAELIIEWVDQHASRKTPKDQQQ